MALEGAIGYCARLGGIKDQEEKLQFRHDLIMSSIVVNAILSPMQERNLSSALGGREVSSWSFRLGEHIQSAGN